MSKPKTFNMALRNPNRDPRWMIAESRRHIAREAAKRRAEQKRARELQALSTIGQDLPCCFVCHGRSLTWDGHPQCRGRRVA